MQGNKTSYFCTGCISIGNNLYFLPATDKCTNPPSFPSNSPPCNREKHLKSIYKKKWYLLKNSKKGVPLSKRRSQGKKVQNTGGSQEMAVMVGQWQNFNSDNSGEFDAISQSSCWDEATHLSEMSILQIFFSPWPFWIGPHLFLQLGCSNTSNKNTLVGSSLLSVLAQVTKTCGAATEASNIRDKMEHTTLIL